MITTKINSPFVFLLAIILAGVAVVQLIDEPIIVQETEQQSLNIKTWQTKNGARVMFVHAKELPMLDVRVVFDAGSARDGNMPGLASMTNAMLDQGAGKWSTDQIAERLDSIGASIGTSALRDMAIVSLRSLTNEPILKKSLDTLVAVLQQPRFPVDDLERERKQVLIALQNKLQSPDDIADELFYQTLYGKHPYASPSIGTTEVIRQLARDDLEQFYKQYYVASNAIIALVGDVNEKQARAITEQLSSGLAKGKPAARVPAVVELKEAKTVKHQHPSTQTHIMVGQPGMVRGDEDYFALYVGNHILGGSGFSSRIVEEIREQRGLAYSSYSYFLPMRDKGPFLMGLQTNNKKAAEALSVLHETLDKFIQQGPTADELEHAQMNITGGFPLRIDSNKDIVQYLAVIGFYDLPLDYLQSFNNKVMAVTRKQIMAAYKKRIHPDKMVTIMVGDLDAAKK